MTGCSVAADLATSTRYDKSVADLQDNVVFQPNGRVYGDIAYVTGYTGYSSDPTTQSGHYLAFTVASDEGASIYAGWDGANWADMTSDGYMVARVDNHDKLYVKTTSDDKPACVKVFDISYLTLEAEN